MVSLLSYVQYADPKLTGLSQKKPVYFGSAYCNELGGEERLLSRACKYTHRQHTAPKKIDCLSILVPEIPYMIIVLRHLTAAKIGLLINENLKRNQVTIEVYKAD